MKNRDSIKIRGDLRFFIIYTSINILFALPIFIAIKNYYLIIMLQIMEIIVLVVSFLHWSIIITDNALYEIDRFGKIRTKNKWIDIGQIEETEINDYKDEFRHYFKKIGDLWIFLTRPRQKLLYLKFRNTDITVRILEKRVKNYESVKIRIYKAIEVASKKYKT